jgi:hypothetical protein
MKTIRFFGAVAFVVSAFSTLHAAPIGELRAQINAAAVRAGVTLAAPALTHAAVRSQAGLPAVDSADRVLADSELLAAAVARTLGVSGLLEPGHCLSLGQGRVQLLNAGDSSRPAFERANSLLHAAAAVRQARVGGGIQGNTLAVNRSTSGQTASEAKLDLAEALLKASAALSAK